MAIARIAAHSFFLSDPRLRQLNKSTGIANKRFTPCSASTIKLELSPCVSSARNGASVAQSIAAKKTSAGPNSARCRADIPILEERRAHSGVSGFRTVICLTSGANTGLCKIVGRQDAKRNRLSVLNREAGEPVENGGRDVLIVVSLALHNAADCDDRVGLRTPQQEVACIREVKRTVHMEHGNILLFDSPFFEYNKCA